MSKKKKRGKAIWIGYDNILQINKFIGLAAFNENKHLSPNDVIGDLLKLKLVPRRLIELIQNSESQIERNAYQKILNELIEVGEEV